MTTIYQNGLDKNPANFENLTSVSFLERTAALYPEDEATVHAQETRTGPLEKISTGKEQKYLLREEAEIHRG